jgi:hypothetical protein
MKMKKLILCVMVMLAACAADTSSIVQHEDEEESGGEGPCPDEGGDCWDDPPYSAGWCADHVGDPQCVPGSCAEGWDGVIDWGFCWAGSVPPNQYGSSWVRDFSCELTWPNDIDWSRCRYSGIDAPGWVPCGQAPSLCDGWDREDWGTAPLTIEWSPPSAGWLGDRAEVLLGTETASEGRVVLEECADSPYSTVCCAHDENLRCCVAYIKPDRHINVWCEAVAQ